MQAGGADGKDRLTTRSLIVRVQRKKALSPYSYGGLHRAAVTVRNTSCQVIRGKGVSGYRVTIQTATASGRRSLVVTDC